MAAQVFKKFSMHEFITYVVELKSTLQFTQNTLDPPLKYLGLIERKVVNLFWQNVLFIFYFLFLFRSTGS